MADKTGYRYNDPDSVWDKNGKRRMVDVLDDDGQPTGEQVPAPGRLANPDNIMDDATFLGHRGFKARRTGPALDYGDPQAAGWTPEEQREYESEQENYSHRRVGEEAADSIKPVPVRQPVKDEPDDRDQNPMAPGGLLTFDPTDEDALMARINELHLLAGDGDRRAAATMMEIARVEYARDEPRQRIKSNLSRCGVRKPES